MLEDLASRISRNFRDDLKLLRNLLDHQVVREQEILHLTKIERSIGALAGDNGTAAFS